jgi:RHS repeat-associated protein
MLLGVVLAGSLSVLGQTNFDEQQGLKPYESWHGGDVDSISLTSGALAVHIPVLGYPQRGSLDLSFTLLYNSKNWTIHTHCTQQTCTSNWVPIPRSGARVAKLTGSGPLPGAYIGSSADWVLQSALDLSSTPQYSAALVSPDGNVHQFGSSWSVGMQYPARSLDATGILNLNRNTVILPNGTVLAYPNGPVTGSLLPSTATDANGNQIIVSSSGWTDTVGRLIPGSAGPSFPTEPGIATADLTTCPAGTSSARVWDVPGLNGGTRRFKLCYSLFAISTNFQRGATEYSANVPLLSALVLPDFTMWTLSYDNYGDLTTLGFPTGGSISYTYAPGAVNCESQTASMWVASRTVDANDGTGPHTWNYHYTGQITSTPIGNGQLRLDYAGTAKVTSPAPELNDTVHTITNPVPGAYCSLYDTQVQYYQGAAGGTPLKTTSTQYNGIQDLNDGTPEIAVNVVTTQSTTAQGGQTATVVSAYDSGNSFTELDGNGSPVTFPVVFGNLIQRDEYDFLNNLIRSTVNHYLWQDNTTYKSNNFVGLMAYTMLKDGSGCEVAKTSYGYDETYNGITLQQSFINTQHVSAPGTVRGNPTSSSKWLISACAEQSPVTSHTIPYDTGLAYQSYDPLAHFTQYTYSSAFAGAYLTQTNLPDTQMPDAGAPVVHHVISGGYDFNTGLLTSFTDENTQPYSYTYDPLMLRLTQGNHPDGGITKFLYPDSKTVERQRLITGTTYDDFKVKFDGVGRPNQTLQFTPDCSSWIKVDTVYDSAGRTKSVSNPYCLTSEPTYGVTQTTYDALSRTLNTTKQDGSVTSIKYEDTPGDTSGAPLVCTTATDESGKKRQACTDAFGRLVKVIEPNPGAAVTTATGSVTINGTEQSGAAAPGSGTVTINGVEQLICQIPNCPPHPTTGDTGTVSITVNGVQKSVSYSKTSNNTSTLVASALASAFHNDGAAPVDATSSGAVVTLTARASGASTNYSLSAASTYNTVQFDTPSYTPQPSGATLTGGHDGALDSGTVSVTINGTVYSITYGSGDTGSTIAGRLAPAINSGSWASASAAGATINLTSKTSGAAGNYTLTSSSTWNTGIFSQPSFTSSNSGSTLSGGKDAAGINNNPFVTLYQYNIRGDMLCVHQKATDTSADVACTGTSAPSVPATWRQRFFTYDSLSRLLTAMNPEMNSTGSTVITYGYDNDSRVTSKTEPAPNAAWGSSSTVTLTYTYDALSRLLDTTFSDGTTLKASHRYDYATFQGQSFTNPIGREVAAFTVNSSGANVASAYTSYDPMGRVLSTTQCNPGVSGCKTFSAGNGGTIQGYNKVGGLLNLIYPSNGFMVTYGYNSAARLTTATDSNGVTYADASAANSYWPSGALHEFVSQNFNNNKYHMEYNNRLQPTEIWAGPTATGALFDKQYQYNPTGQTQVNNGNIYTITNVKDSTRTQTFTYDPLNRLLTAGDQTHWSNSYVYDAWGNLYQKNPGTLPGEGLSKVPDTNNHLSGMTYDAGGNVTNDGLGGTFVFDGENRIKSAGSVTYTYDADGRRVQKSTGINYWYGPGGQVLAETDSSGNWTNYIFFGGERLARNIPQTPPAQADIKYYITDHLHSTGMFVDQHGASYADVLDDNDFYPWGGVVPGVGKTTSNNTIKFTGKYRDTDTAANLDYFGARYYSNTIGRFMSTDWAAKPTTVPYAKFGDPQSLNLYSYVENGPINSVDVDGHSVVVLDDGNPGFNSGPMTIYINCNSEGCTSSPYDDGSANSSREETATFHAQLANPGPGSVNPGPAQQQPAQQQMSVSQQGQDFIKSYEQLSLTVYDANKPKGDWTIGYGHKVQSSNVPAIGKAQAEQLFSQDVSNMAAHVNHDLKVSVTQNQFDALVSLRFNAGQNAITPPVADLNRTGHATKGDFTNHYITAGGVRMGGLEKRREAEWKIFSQGVYNATH